MSYSVPQTTTPFVITTDLKKAEPFEFGLVNKTHRVTVYFSSEGNHEALEGKIKHVYSLHERAIGPDGTWESNQQLDVNMSTAAPEDHGLNPTRILEFRDLKSDKDSRKEFRVNRSELSNMSRVYIVAQTLLCEPYSQPTCTSFARVGSLTRNDLGLDHLAWDLENGLAADVLFENNEIIFAQED